jgi:hypothetical protein
MSRRGGGGGGGYVKNNFVFFGKRKQIIFVFDYENIAKRIFREYFHHKLSQISMF